MPRRWSAPAEGSPPTGTAAAVGDRGTFCLQDFDVGHQVRAPVTLRHLSGLGAFWVADEDQPAVDALLAAEPGFLTNLGDALDEHIAPTLTSVFGPFTNVDGDRRVAVVFRRLGANVTGATTSPTPIADRSADCSGGGSNAVDLVQLTDPVSLASSQRTGGAPDTPDVLAGDAYPTVLSHELTHLSEMQRASEGLSASPWIVEGLAEAGSDLAGYVDVVFLRSYLSRFGDDSLTGWYLGGNDVDLADYGGVQLLFHLVRERIGDGFLHALFLDSSWDTGAFTRATGFPIELALVHLATTALFSNEDFSPAPWADLVDPLWTPLHDRIGAVTLTPLPAGTAVTAVVQPDGWRALVTGDAGTDPVALSVAATGKKPWVIVARFRPGP